MRPLAGLGLIALLAGLCLAAAWGAGAAWGYGLADSSWPAFHHDNQRIGVTGEPGVGTAGLRWWQETGGPVLSSPVVSAQGGVRKIWYLHAESWTGRAPVLVLGSRAPEAAAQDIVAAVPGAGSSTVAIFETSSALTELAGGTSWQPDPFRTTIPAGTWRFVFWGRADVARQVRVHFRVLRFPGGDPDNVTELFSTHAENAAGDSLDPMLGTDLTQCTVEHAAPGFNLAASDGIRVEMVMVSETDPANVTVRIEGDSRSRVETPIWAKCVLGGADDGSLYAMDASTGNIFWTVGSGGQAGSTPVTVVSATRASGVVTIITASDHGLQVGEAVTVAGVVSSGGTDFNGLYHVSSVPNSTTLTYRQRNVPDDTGTGGTVARAAFLDRIRGAPAVDDEGVIYVGTQEAGSGGDYATGRLYAINPDGSVKWVFPSYRPKFYLRSTDGTVTTTDRMDYVPTNTEDYTSGATPQAANNADYYLITPGAQNTSFLAELPVGVTNYGWIGEKDWSGRQLLAGAWTLNLGLRLVGAGTLPKGNLYYRLSKVTIQGGAIVRSQELLGWTASDLLQPTAWFDSGNPEGTTLYLHLNTPQAASCSFAAGEYCYIEFAIKQTSDSANGASWRLVVDNQDSTVQTAGVQSGTIEAIANSPAVSEDGIVYFGTLGGRMYALENDGSLRWESELPGSQEIRSSPALSRADGDVPGRVYVGGMDGYLYALDGNDGTILTGVGYENWPVNVGAPIEASPVVASNGTVYVACNRSNDGTVNGRLLSVNGATGAINWTFTPGNGIATMAATPALSGDEATIYAGSDDGHLYAVSAADGSQLWQFPAAGDPLVIGFVRSSPLVANGRVEEQLYLTGAGTLALTVPSPGPSVTGVSGTATGYLVFGPAGASMTTELPTGSPNENQAWYDEAARGGQVMQEGNWHLRLHYAKVGTATQAGYLHYRLVKKNPSTGTFAVLKDWTRWDTLLDATDTTEHVLAVDTGKLGGVTFAGDDRIYLQLAIQQTVAGSDANDGWTIGVGSSDNYLQVAPVGGERIHFGAGDGNVYCVTAAGVERWRWPGTTPTLGFVSSPALTSVSEEEMLYLRAALSGTLGVMEGVAGDAANTATRVTSGTTISTQGGRRYFEVQALLDNSTASTSLPAYGSTPDPPHGWVNTQNRPGRTWESGKWQVSLGYAVSSIASRPQAYLWYRLSKVTVSGGVLTSRTTLLDWQRHSEVPLSPSGLEMERVTFDTAVVPAVVWGDGEYPYLELYLEPVAGGEDGLQWIIETNTAQDYLRPTGTAEEAVLYIGGTDWLHYAIGPLGPTGTIPGGEDLPVHEPTPGRLHLTKSVDKQVAALGETVTYTIRVRNDSVPGADLDGANITIYDPIPLHPSNPGELAIDPATVVPPPDANNEVVFDSSTDAPLGALMPGDTYEVRWSGTVRVESTDPTGTTVSVYDTDPTPATPAEEVFDYRWGQLLFLDVKNRGQSLPIVNRAYAVAADYAEGESNEASTEAGYGHRYRLTFSYEPEYTSPTIPASNQPIHIATEVQLTASGEYRGQQEEGVEYGAADTALKLEIVPRGFPYSPSAMSVTEAPNRPWTPYHWRVVVQQQKAGPEGWGPAWGTTRAAPTRDFSLLNPLAVTPANTSKNGLYPGTATDSWGQDGTEWAPAFTARNVSMLNLSSGSVNRPTNVVRWGGTGLVSGGSGYNAPPYVAYDEDTLTPGRLHFTPEYMGLGRGQQGGPALWAQVPRFLSPGTYSADFPIYVDLTGSESWDPGEAYYEEADGTRFVLSGTILQEPRISTREPLLDLSRYPHGSGTDSVITVQNEGNLGFVTGTGTGVSLQTSDRYVQRSELQALSLLGDEQARPIDWTLPANSFDVAKQPVGSYRLAPTELPLEPVLGEGQPVGHYLGRLTFSSGATPLLEVPLKATVTERRVLENLGSTTPVPGIDVQPFAYWRQNSATLGDWSLELFWAGRHPDTNTFYLYRNTGVMALDFTDPQHPTVSYTWGTNTRIPPAAGTDPLDLPAPAGSKRHLTPAAGPDEAGNHLLFWGGGRGGAGETAWTDNRLLWTDLGTGDTTWAPDPTSDARSASASLRLHPGPLGWTVRGVTPDNLRMVSRRLLSVFAQGNGDDWRLLVNCERSEQSRPDPGQEWGAPSEAVYEELAVPLGQDISSAQEPTAVRDARRLYYLHAEQALEGGVRLLDTWGPDAPGEEIALTVSTGEPNEPSPEASFRTDPGDPGRSGATAIPAGTWLFQVMARGPEGTTLTFKVRRVSAGTVSDLITAGPSTPLTPEYGLAEAVVEAPDVALAAGDQLQVEVFASGPGAWLACDGISTGGGGLVVGGSRVMMPVHDDLANVVFTGRAHSTGNADLYYVRFDPSRDTLGKAPGLSSFGVVREQLTATDSNRQVYFTRHKGWQHEAGFQLYDWYDEGSGTPTAHAITATSQGYDAASGEYTLRGTSLGEVRINVDSGRIRLGQALPSGHELEVYYVPRLLRLTESPGNDFSPSVFVETYRYVSLVAEPGVKQPEAFRPRLWVFWVRSGGPGLGNALYWKTYRPGSQLGDPDWTPELRVNSSDGRWDVGETMVPVDHSANEFGISACKDPIYAQVWLFWSSTRGKPGAVGGEYDADLYYQVIAPPLPD